MAKNPCPLLRKYEVEQHNPAEFLEKPILGEETNWAKEICWLYCPLDVCIFDRKRARATKEEREIIERIEIPIRLGRQLICRRCGGQVMLDCNNNLICLQCSKEYSKERE